tara:strand:+ start:280 stop:477 length:198 start_codon:yes stop_codon:yes gene_type:complete
MAKSSIIQREKKRASLVAKFTAKRSSIKNKLRDENLTYEEASLLRKKLQKLHLTLCQHVREKDVP